MVNVNVLRDKEKRVLAFQCKGHAGYAKRANELDVVCAAVSGIVYTALGYMEEYYGMQDFTEQNGFIKWNRPDSINPEALQTITPVLDAMVVGLKQIEMQYGKHIKVVDEEV